MLTTNQFVAWILHGGHVMCTFGYAVMPAGIVAMLVASLTLTCNVITALVMPRQAVE
jgi:hypothetical protein